MSTSPAEEAQINENERVVRQELKRDVVANLKLRSNLLALLADTEVNDIGAMTQRLENLGLKVTSEFSKKDIDGMRKAIRDKFIPSLDAINQKKADRIGQDMELPRVTSDRQILVQSSEELRNLFAELISTNRPEHKTLTEGQMSAVLQRLHDPETVANLRARKKMREELVVKFVDGKPTFVNAANKLDVPKTVARLRALTSGEYGQQMIDNYVQYEVQRGKKHIDPLTDEEAPEFSEWMRSEMDSMEYDNEGPNRTGAGFVAWAHNCRLVSIEDIEELASDNMGVNEATLTWAEEGGKILLDVWRHAHKYAPRCNRYRGRAGLDVRDADFRDDRLGARLVG